MRMIYFVLIFLTGSFCVAEQAGRDEIEKSEHLQKQIIVDDYSFMGEDPNSENRAELNSLVNELNALTFQLKLEKAESKEDANEVTVDVNEVQEVDPAEIIDEFKINEKFAVDANSVIEPVKLGDVLYNRGLHLKAAIYYKKAFADLQDRVKIDPSRQGWVLFQLGNCYKNTDSSKAVKYYNKLIEVLPDSKWSEIALIEKQLAELVIEEKEIFESMKDKEPVDG